MSKEEIVRVVCRALAVIQIVTAVLEMSELPGWFVALARDVKRANSFVAYDRIEIAFFFFRIAFLLICAAALWKCGPWIQRVMGIAQQPNEQGQPS